MLPPPPSPCGFSALPCLYYLVRPTKTAMLCTVKHLFHSQVHKAALLFLPQRSYNSLFHARWHRAPSFWSDRTTRFDSVDITCQIWPITGYTRSWYTGTSRLKKWLQAPSLFLSPVFSRFCFVLLFFMSALSQFSRPDYLGAWNRLGLEVRVHLGKKFNGYAPVIERCESLRPNAAACNATILVYALTFLKQAGLVRALAILCSLTGSLVHL